MPCSLGNLRDLRGGGRDVLQLSGRAAVARVLIAGRRLVLDAPKVAILSFIFVKSETVARPLPKPFSWWREGYRSHPHPTSASLDAAR